MYVYCIYVIFLKSYISFHGLKKMCLYQVSIPKILRNMETNPNAFQFTLVIFDKWKLI